MFKKIVGTAVSAILCASLVTGAVLTSHAADDLSDALLEEDHMATISDTNEGGAYLFVHFIGNESSEDHEQVYFSVSKDGTRWKTLNNTKPVLKSDVGEKGIRDPHIIRSPEGDKFYMIATDLSIYNLGKRSSNPWTDCQTNGSRNIVVWESDDLVNWTCKGLKEIARENATNAWAPESVWDEERQAYMVFWASKTTEDWRYRIYRSYTTDYETFTEPEVYIESDGSRIDTTFIKEGDTYYRFTKNEENDAKYVYMEKSKSLSGEFEVVSTYSLNGKHYTEEGTAFEGPTAYKLHGEEKWCLLLDSWEYKPFETDDISKGRFVSAGDFNFNGVTFRHGTVMPITMEEYDRLVDKWADGEDLFEEDVTEGDLVYSLDFDNPDNRLEAGGTLGSNASTGTSGLTYVDGVNGGTAVKFSNNNYITVAKQALAGVKCFTVSFAAQVTKERSWLFYADGKNGGGAAWQNEKYLGVVWGANGTLTMDAERYNLTNSGDRPENPSTDNIGAFDGTTYPWVHVTVVYHVDKTDLYINGQFVQSKNSGVSIADLLSDTNNIHIRLGSATWSGGEWADAAMDCFKIHNYVLDKDAISALYKSDMGIA